MNGAKQKLGWPLEPSFYIPEQVLALFRQAVERGKHLESAWKAERKAYREAFPELDQELERRLVGKLPEDWEKTIPVFPADPKGMATRAASGKVLNALANAIPELMGGSADLAPSNNTWISGLAAFQKATPEGRNFHFGVREHGMGALVNGMAVHGGVIPYGATFLVFSDYMRGALRLSALSHYPSIWIFTHDSIGLGEDGPTHQPVEHVAALRAIPNLVVLRPADANETAEAWRAAIKRRQGPTALILTRQAVPVFDRRGMGAAGGLQRGAYVLADLGQGTADILLMASGSEVSLILEAGVRLSAEGLKVRLVSFPSWELFSEQEAAYQEKVLPANIPVRLAVEAGISQGWERWTGSQGAILGVERFGASAPYQTIYEQYGLTVCNVVELAHTLLAEKQK